MIEIIDGIALADVLICDAEAGDLDEAFDELREVSQRKGI